MSNIRFNAWLDWLDSSNFTQIVDCVYPRLRLCCFIGVQSLSGWPRIVDAVSVLLGSSKIERFSMGVLWAPESSVAPEIGQNRASSHRLATI